MNETPSLKPFWQQKYRQTTAKSWNDFYKRHTVKAYKDRHWLDQEFDLRGVGLEVGCGVGNLLYPALQTADEMYACDFSPQAIEFVKAHEEYTEGKVHAFVADITQPLPDIPKVDFITCIFVLSAIPPELHHRVLMNLAAVLKPDGKIYFRDYAVDDLTQRRFQAAVEVPKLESNLYVRSDGTMSYFFSEEYAAQLPLTKTIKIVSRRTTNRKLGVDEERLFCQIVFSLSS